MCTRRPQLGPVFVAFLPPRRLSGPRGQFSRACGRGVLGVRTGGPGHSCESLKLKLREKETNTRVVWWGNNILDSFHGRGQDRWAGYVGKPKTLLILSNPSCLCPVLFKVPKKCDLTTSFWTFCDLWCEDRLMGLACSSHAWKRVKTRGRGRLTV